MTLLIKSTWYNNNNINIFKLVNNFISDFLNKINIIYYIVNKYKYLLSKI